MGATRMDDMDRCYGCGQMITEDTCTAPEDCNGGDFLPEVTGEWLCDECSTRLLDVNERELKLLAAGKPSDADTLVGLIKRCETLQMQLKMIMERPGHMGDPK